MKGERAESQKLHQDDIVHQRGAQQNEKVFGHGYDLSVAICILPAFVHQACQTGVAMHGYSNTAFSASYAHKQCGFICHKAYIWGGAILDLC
jgi:hypothetical protein